MLKRYRALTALLVTPLIATVAATALGRPAHPKSGPQQCPLDCGVKLEHSPWEYSGDRAVIAICLKAGQGRFSFTQNGTHGCYTVSGLGTTHVTVTGGGTGRDCKDISNVVFYFDCGGPPG